MSAKDVGSPQIAGTIGTGLFLGIGQILAVTGPLGMLLVYLHIATVIYAYVLISSRVFKTYLTLYLYHQVNGFYR